MITSDLKRERVACARARNRHTPRRIRGFLYLLAAISVVSCSDTQVPTAPGPASPPGPDAVASVTVTAESPEVAVAGQAQLQVTVRDASGSELAGREVSWTSSDPAVATVSAAGIVSGVALGSATITAKAEGVKGTIQIDVQGYLIGTSGGEAVSADGFASARIPAGALADPVVITVTPANSADLPTQNDDVFVKGSAYEFGPSGQQFAEPVELRIRYFRVRVPENIHVSSLHLGRVEGDLWTNVGGGSVDMSADEVSGSVTGFSIYGSIGEPFNIPPVATITAPADGSSFPAGTSVTFTGTGKDPDNGALPDASLKWLSDLDGPFGTGESVTTSGLSIGVHRIRFKVTDSGDRRDRAEITVTITNNLPTAAITSPADGSSFPAGTSVTFTGTGTDPDDGSLSGASLEWTSDLDGTIGTGESVATSGLSVGDHTITLTVTDAHGGTDTDQITVTVTLTPPSAWINEPADGSSFLAGTPVTFRGGGSAAQASLSWTSDLDGQFGNRSQVITSALSVGIHTITWAVTTAGGTGTDQITVTILPAAP